MTKLTNAKVYRGGPSAGPLKEETDKVELSSERTVSEGRGRGRERWSWKEKLLQFRFSLKSKGGGTTKVHLNIEKESFPQLIQAMVAVDREYTMGAFVMELSAAKLGDGFVKLIGSMVSGNNREDRQSFQKLIQAIVAVAGEYAVEAFVKQLRAEKGETGFAMLINRMVSDEKIGDIAIIQMSRKVTEHLEVDLDIA